VAEELNTKSFVEQSKHNKEEGLNNQQSKSENEDPNVIPTILKLYGS